MRGEMEREAKKAHKVEQKVNILIGGLQARDTKLTKQVGGWHTGGLAGS